MSSPPQSPRTNVPYCPKHGSQQQPSASNPLSYSVCMMHHCANQYQVLCPACKNSHQTHYNKVLGVIELKQLTQNLIDKPFHKAKQYILELIHIMEALQWINCFKSQIINIQQEIRRETLNSIDLTQGLISDYAYSKQSAYALLSEIHKIASKDKKIKANFLKNNVRQQLPQLRSLHYNKVQNILEYSGPQMKHKQVQRKASINWIMKRIDDIKDYSLKIIQVTITPQINQEEQIQDQDPQKQEKQRQVFINKKHQYQRLKKELRMLQKMNAQKKEKKLERAGSQTCSTVAFGSEGSGRIHKGQRSDIFHSPSDSHLNFHNINDQNNGSIRKVQYENSKYKEQDQQHLKHKQQQQQIINRYQTALKEYQKKFIDIEQKIKNLQNNYQKKLNNIEEQKIKLQKQNERIVKQNKKMLKQFQDRIQIMKKYEKQLKQLKSKFKIQSHGKLVRTNSLKNSGILNRSPSKDQLPNI